MKNMNLLEFEAPRIEKRKIIAYCRKGLRELPLRTEALGPRHRRWPLRSSHVDNTEHFSE